MLLGTYHMDNPGLDEFNLKADDVLAPKRQEELRNLTNRLADWRPDRIAVERPYERQEDVNSLYERFRSGERRYDRRPSDSTADFRELESDAEGEIRSEVVQVGFRLADELNHDEVYAIDAPMDISNEELEALEERDFQPESKMEYDVPDGNDVIRGCQERLVDSIVIEFLHWLNRSRSSRFNHELMFDKGIRWGEGDNFGGPRMLAAWYDRNVRTVHNLWRVVEAGDERALVLVGSGHVRVLRHLLDESPMFCPVSPLPYLPHEK